MIELKGAPVYAAYRPICHRYVSASPDTDPTALDQAREVLEKKWKATKKQRALADYSGSGPDDGETGRE